MDQTDAAPSDANNSTSKEPPSKKRKTKDGKKKLESLMDEASDRSKDLKHGQPAILTGGELRRYQLVGMNWIVSLYENGVNGILADEMGLGKTIQTISSLAHLYEMGVKGPFLVCAPLSTISNWLNEFQRFTPSMKAIMYHGTKDERSELRSQHFPKIKSQQISTIITSFEIAMRDKKFLKQFKYRFLVVDEAHRLKNFDCRLTRELKQYHSDNRLLLTGTPLQNNLTELWSLLNFLLPDVFDDLESFKKWFDFASSSTPKPKSTTRGRKRKSATTTTTATTASDASDFIKDEKDKLVNKLHSILRPFLLRRLKTDVELNLPNKKEYLIFTPLVDFQSQYYKMILSKDFNAIFEDNKIKPKTSQLLNVLMQLRKVCNHPFLINEFETNLELTNQATDEQAELTPQQQQEENERFKKQVVERSSKFQLLIKMLDRLKKSGHKVLIFSLMTRMLDVLEDYLVLTKYKYCRLDGSVAQQDRQESIKNFNADPDLFIFLLSTRAGGLGINLTAADTVIIYDSDWNPQIDLQAMDRCHRIGQTRPVRVFRLLTYDTVEKKILETANKKLQLERLIIQQGNFKGLTGTKQDDGKKMSITAQNLLDILRTGASDKKHEHGISDENLYKLLSDRGTHDLEDGPGWELVRPHVEGFHVE
ncbi:hypothetical protein AKO1_011648 [Acrasis kona]|uniref:Uncharacterized protein n=1 Tax=Acrasis kona TaxID=1008807 RepID=A0AAW2Z718_9EUKA